MKTHGIPSTKTEAGLAAALVIGGTLLFSGCTQAFVEIRHDRPGGVNNVPNNTLSIGARWFVWDAYADHLAEKMESRARELALRDAWRKP